MEYVQIGSHKGQHFEEMPIPFSSVAEQTVIGNFFRNLGEQLTAQAAKLEQPQQLKTAYLKAIEVLLHNGNGTLPSNYVGELLLCRIKMKI